MIAFFKRPKKSADESSIGHLLVVLGFITKDQLRDAIDVKLATHGEALLGEVLIARGAITRSQLERVLVAQREARGEKIDYANEIVRIMAGATARAETLTGQLTDLESAAKRVSTSPLRLAHSKK